MILLKRVMAVGLSAAAFGTLMLFAAGCGSVDEPAKPAEAVDPAVRTQAYKTLLWADDIKVAQQRLREAQIPFDQVMPRLEERPLYNYLAFVDEPAVTARFGGKRSFSDVNSRISKLFNYRILKIPRGGGEARLYFLEKIPYTREYLFDEKKSEDYSMAKSELARVLIEFDPTLAPADVAAKVREEYPDFESMDKPFRVNVGEMEVQFYPAVKPDAHNPARGATLVKTSTRAMAEYKKAVTDKLIELLDAKDKKNDKDKKKSLDY